MAANKKKHLDKEERFCIDRLLRQGKSFGEIGRTLGRGLSTISEEVNANSGRTLYDADRANHRAYLKQYWKKKNCNAVAINPHISRFVERKLEKGWSPDTISMRLESQSGTGYPSPNSLRTHIDRRSGLERFLFWNRTNMKSGHKRSKAIFLADPGRKSIDLRPLSALFDYGHWEGDFIVSKHNSWVLLVLVEKFSKTVLLALLPNRNNDLVNTTITNMLKGFTVKTLTLDNDIAFAKWRELEAMLGAEIYFCHPYHSWEKGLVENVNRWIRPFIPKRSNLAMYEEQDIKWVEAWFNHTPRQCLSGATPHEIMMEQEYQKAVVSLEVNLPRLRIWG